MESQSCQITISLLGQPLIQQNDILIKIQRKKCRALLYYLASCSSPVSKEKVQDIFWPDQEAASAQHNLRAHVYEVRKQLPGLILSDDSYVQLAPEIKTDTRRFDVFFAGDQSDEEELKKILTLYRGSFLDGFAIDNSPGFDHWKLEQQEHFNLLFIRGLIKSAEYAQNRSDYHSGILALQQALSMDPLQEEVYRRMMLLQYHTGDFLQISKTYNKLKEILAEEMGLVPMAETEALYNALITGNPLGKRGGSDKKPLPDDRFKQMGGRANSERFVLPFAGRDQELAQIDDLIRQRGLVVIEGGPGRGKTRLIEEYMQHWQGLSIYGYCLRLERDISYQPLLEAIKGFIRSSDWRNVEDAMRNDLSSWWNELRYLVPEIDAKNRTQPQIVTDKYRIMEAVSQFFIALSRTQKVLFALDDLQWADNDSLVLFSYLVRQCQYSNGDIFFLGTQSNFQNPQLIKIKETLNRLNLLQSITLDLLSKETIKFFAGQLTTNEKEKSLLAEWLEQISEGHAYTIAELMTVIRKKINGEGETDIQSIIQSTILPQSVDEYIYSALLNLPEQAQRILEVAAVCGTTFNIKMVSGVINSPQVDIFNGLEELLSKGLIVVRNNQEYAFHHRMVKEVAYSHINPSRRQWIQGCITEAAEANVGIVGEADKGAPAGQGQLGRQL